MNDQKEASMAALPRMASTWLSVWLGTDPRNLVFYKDLTDPAAQVVELIRESRPATALSMMVRFSVPTNLDASRGRVIAIDTTNPARDQWQEIILRQMKHSKVLV